MKKLTWSKAAAGIIAIMLVFTASFALADLVEPEKLSDQYVIPAAFDPRVGPAVAKAVAQAARDSGVARL